jgi:hypothetical protein
MDASSNNSQDSWYRVENRKGRERNYEPIEAWQHAMIKAQSRIEEAKSAEKILESKARAEEFIRKKSEPTETPSRDWQNFAKVPVTAMDKMTVDDLVHLIPTPEQASKRKRIFLPPVHLGWQAIAFGSLSRAKLSRQRIGLPLGHFCRRKVSTGCGRKHEEN